MYQPISEPLAESWLRVATSGSSSSAGCGRRAAAATCCFVSADGDRLGEFRVLRGVRVLAHLLVHRGEIAVRHGQRALASTPLFDGGLDQADARLRQVEGTRLVAQLASSSRPCSRAFRLRGAGRTAPRRAACRSAAARPFRTIARPSRDPVYARRKPRPFGNRVGRPFARTNARPAATKRRRPDCRSRAGRISEPRRFRGGCARRASAFKYAMPRSHFTCCCHISSSDWASSVFAASSASATHGAGSSVGLKLASASTHAGRYNSRSSTLPLSFAM